MSAGWLIVVAIVAASAATAVAVTTRNGPWDRRDSGVYAGIADNLRSGRGPTVPFETKMFPGDLRADLAALPELPSELYPPGYPAALAVGEATGLGRGDAGRAVNVAAMVLLVAAVAGSTLRLLPAAPSRAVMVAAVVGFLPTTQALATQYMSDLMALALTAVAWWALMELLVRRGTRAGAVAAAVYTVAAVGLVLTRNAGIALAPAAVVVAWFAWRSWWRAALLAVPTLGAAGAWSLVVQSSGGERVLSAHIEPTDVAREVLTTSTSWFASSTAPTWMRATVAGAALVMLAIVAGTAVAARRGLPDDGEEARVSGGVTPDRLPSPGRLLGAVIVAYVIAYLGVVTASRFFVGDGIPFNPRMLAPVQVAVVMLGALGLHRASVEHGTRLLAGVVALVVAGLLVNPWRSDAAWSFVGRSSTAAALSGGVEPEPVPYALGVAATLPDAILVVTNAPERLWYGFARSSLAIPLAEDGNRGEPNARFESELDALGDIVRERPTVVVVVFDRATDRLLRRHLDPCQVERVRSGVLLYAGAVCADVSLRPAASDPAS